MIRALRPYLALAVLIAAGAGIAYGLGAPVWVPYAAILLVLVTVLPGYDRWDRRNHPE
jgi:hypothetical protein